MKVIITGAPGVGKSSVAKGLERHGWTLVTFGSIMFEIARKRHGITSRDQLRSEIKVSDYKKIQLKTADTIARMKGRVLIDTHASMFKRGWFYPGLPGEQLKRIKPDGFVVVEAGEKDLAKRRKEDKGRKRDDFPDNFQDINRYYMSAYSAITGAPVLYVENRQGKLEATIEAVKKALDFL